MKFHQIPRQTVWAIAAVVFLIALNCVPQLYLLYVASQIQLKVENIFRPDGSNVALELNPGNIARVLGGLLGDQLNPKNSRKTEGPTYTVRVHVSNNSGAAVTLDKADCEIWAEDERIGFGNFQDQMPIRIAGHQERTLFLPLTLEHPEYELLRAMKFNKIELRYNCKYRIARMKGQLKGVVNYRP